MAQGADELFFDSLRALSAIDKVAQTCVIKLQFYWSIVTKKLKKGTCPQNGQVPSVKADSYYSTTNFLTIGFLLVLI